MSYDTSKINLFGKIFLGAETATYCAQGKESKKADTNNQKEFFRKSHLT